MPSSRSQTAPRSTAWLEARVTRSQKALFKQAAIVRRNGFRGKPVAKWWQKETCRRTEERHGLLTRFSDFMKGAVKKQKGLQVHILEWDFAVWRHWTDFSRLASEHLHVAAEIAIH